MEIPVPHITLEYSSNLVEQKDLVPVLKKAQVLLSESLPAQLDQFKSRALGADVFLVGDGNHRNAFVHMQVDVMAGRSDETLSKAGHQLIDLLKDSFKQTIKSHGLSISVEISELSKAYFKWDPEG
jgi:5-carboxymethyl-2-hydroxymuconate isomerase